MLLISLTLFLFYSLVASLTLYYVLFVYKNSRFFKFAWNHHGFFLPLLPMVGNSLFWFFPILPNGLPVNILSLVQWGRKHFGFPLNFWFGSAYCYVTSNPEEIKIIFTHPKCYSKGVMYKPGLLVFSELSIFLASYEEWKIRRALFQGSFKSSVLKTFVPTYYQQSCKLVEDIDNMNNTQNLFTYMFDYSFLNFLVTASGLEENKWNLDQKQFGTTIIRIQNILGSKIFDPLIPINTWIRFFPSGRKCKKDINKMNETTRSLYLQKRQQYGDQIECSNTNQDMPLLDFMVKVLAKNMDEKEILSEINFFTVAVFPVEGLHWKIATETTGIVLTFCFMLLGIHPEVQETLYQEVINEIGENNISSDDLPRLKYTEAVIHETLRLFPPVPFLQRHIGEDINLGNQVIPNGTHFSVDIFHLHRDEKYWPHPLKFDPTRFLPENASKIKPYTYIPFSAGPRDCLGKRQAMFLMKTTVANLVRKLKITSTHKSVDEIVLTSVASLKAAYPINCQFSTRLTD